MSMLTRICLQKHSLRRARKVVRGFFASNLMILKFNSEIGNFGTLLRSFQNRVIRNMKRRKVCLEAFHHGWENALEKVRNLSLMFPEKRILWIDKYYVEIQEKQVLKELFEIVWNYRLLEYLRSRIKTEVYKVSDNKSDYTVWRLDLMEKLNYANEHIGFEKIMHMEGLAKFVEYHKWNETYVKAIKRVPETLVNDVLLKSTTLGFLKSKLGELQQVSEDSNAANSKEEILPFKFLIGSPPPVSAQSRLKSKLSLSVKLGSAGLSLKQLGKALEKTANASPTKGKLMESKFNIAQLLKKTEHTVDLGFSDKFFFNLLLATTLYFLNRDGIPF